MAEEANITASYIWTADELIKARENHWRAQCRRPYRVGIVFLSLMAILAGLAYYFSQGWSVPAVLFPLGGIYFLFLRKYDCRGAARRHFKRRPDRNSEVSWNFSPEEIHIQTAESELRMKWSQITKVRKAKNGFLLYPNDLVFYWFPFTAVAQESELNQIEQILRDKVEDFQNIK